MQFNPRNVIILLSAVFTILDFPDSPVTSDELAMGRKVELMLKEMYENGFEFEEEESLDFENAYDVPEAEQIELVDEEDNYAYNVKEMPCDVDDIPIEYKREAVHYWRSNKASNPRKIESVQSKFRKVSSARQLRRWETQLNESGNRFEKLRQLSAYTLDKFIEAIERRAIVHDIDITRWALQAQEEINLSGFTASHEWVRRFKLGHKIVSRKITKFITRKALMSKTAFETESNRFVENVRYYIERYGTENIYNSDQSGFQLEFHSGRTLTQKGVKTVESVAQSTSALTHSYTIQPIISAEGKLLSPLFIVLKETSGTFGPRVQGSMFTANNIFVMASKSGKLTSNHFEMWLKEVFFPHVGKNSVLLLDSWTGHCPDIIQRNKPDDFEITLLTIPAGTTGRIQPLDVYGFRLWKQFIRYFSDIVMLLGLDVQLHSRNSILKLQSLTHYQFSSPRFTNLFKYAWYKSGYLEYKPPEFDTPADFCFKKQSKSTCDICGALSVITCAWCKQSLCITHFFHDHHICNQYNP